MVKVSAAVPPTVVAVLVLVFVLVLDEADKLLDLSNPSQDTSPGVPLNLLRIVCIKSLARQKQPSKIKEALKGY